MKFLVTDQLQRQHGIRCRPGSKVQCPFCGHETFSIKQDDAVGKCFHPQCGHSLTPATPDTDEKNKVYKLLEHVYRDFHIALLRQRGQEGRTAYSYLIDERRIHEEVVEQTMVGAVPPCYEVMSLFENAIKTAEDRLTEARGVVLHQADERIVEFLIECRDKLAALIKNCGGWLVFFYSDAFHRVVSMRVREPYTKNFLQFKPTSLSGVFGYGLISPNTTPYFSLGEQVIVVEGEINLLQLESLCVCVADQAGRPLDEGYIPVMAVGGVHNVDTKTIRKITSFPIVIYDNDESNAGFELVARLNKAVHLAAVTTPGRDSDLDSYIRELMDVNDDPTEAARVISDLVDSREVFYRPLQYVREEIDAVRRPKAKSFDIHRNVTDIIYMDLKFRGQLYRDNHRTFLLRLDESRLMEIDPDSIDLRLLLSAYGISPVDQVFKHVIHELRHEALRTGTDAKVHVLSHYDRATNTLCLYNHDGEIYKITTGSIEAVVNGTDGVLFLHDPSCKPFYLGERGDKSLLSEMVIDPILLKAGRLTVGQRRALFLIWMLSLLFPEVLKSRTIAAFVGEAGSGKTFVFRVVGKLLIGPQFDVTPLTKDPKDFDAAITNAPFVAIDNADTKSDWLEDRLAIVATGASIKRRVYYTTNQLVAFPVTAFLGVTSRTPYFRRADIADRLLVFPVERRLKFVSETMLLARLEENRDALFSEIVHLLQDVLRARESTADREYQTTFRMADFADFALRIADHQGQVAEMEGIFEKLADEQADFALEEDPLVHLLRLWLQRKKNVGREVSTKELCSLLGRVAQKEDIEFIYSGNARKLGQRFKNLKTALRRVFEITERTTSGGLVRSFKPRGSLGSLNEGDPP